MRTKYKYLILLLLLSFEGRSQASLDSVIAVVRSANKELIASRLQMEAEMKEARTGIYLPNPEIQFDYLWGDPASFGNRTDFGISQSFSFPSVYVQKSNQMGLVRTNASLSYIQKEREVLQKAKMTWINQVGINKQLTLIGHRVKLAEEISVKAKIQLSRGEIDVIRYHHAQMEYVNLKMERNMLDVELNTIQTRLVQLCGGRSVRVTDTAYPPLSSWSLSELVDSLAGTPRIKSLENEISIRNLDKHIAVSEWLPKFKAGYYAETVSGLKYQGITTGISIPLFQNSNSVKTAELRAKTATAELDQFRFQRTAAITSLLNKREKLSAQVQEIQSALLPVNDVSLLKKALDAGEINISEFYYECSVFYAAWSNLIASEQELALTETELLYAAGR